MKKILFITRELNLGGAAYLTLRYIKRLVDHFEIDLLVVGPLDSEMKSLISDKVSFYHFSDLNEKEPFDGLEAFEAIQKYIFLKPFQTTYDAVIATSIYPSWEACLSFCLIDSPVKYSFLLDESLTNYDYFPKVLKDCVDFSISSTSRFLPVSRKLWQKVAASCPAIIGIPIYVSQPIVEVEKIKSTKGSNPKELPTALTVARLSQEKQIPQSLYIHRQLTDKGIFFKWYVIGSGPQMDFLQREIQRLEMQDYFILLGPMANNEVFDWMNACDFFVLFSKSEGCPTVVMEALVMNRPVLATDVNGIDELIQNGQTGLIVQNDLDDMEAGLQKLVLDNEFRRQMHKNLMENPREIVYEQNLEKFILEVKTQLESPVMNPRVTILIIAFNHEQCISKAISSAMMQDYKELEVIVVDDASTDETGNQAMHWGHFPGFRYVRNSVNLGRVKNYRRAISEVANTEWVLLLDGDDYLVDSKFISKAIEARESFGNESTKIIQAGHRVFFENSGQKSIDILPGFSEPARLFQHAEYLKFVYETGFFTHLGTLFKREEAVRIGCYTAEISSTDMDGLLRLALEGNVLVLNQIAGNWVHHGQNASNQLDFKDIIDNVRLFRIIANQAKQKKLISTQEIEPVLTKYQASTLASLFTITLSQKPIHPKYLLRMIRTTWLVRPQLLIQEKIIWSILGYSKKSLKYFLSHILNKVELIKKRPDFQKLQKS